MERRSVVIRAAAILGLVLGVAAPTRAGAQDPGASVSFTPASVPVHGTISVTASCPFHGPGASAAIAISRPNELPTIEAVGFPLVEDGELLVDLPLRRGFSGTFDVVLSCGTGTGAPSIKARAAGLTLTEPSVPQAALPTIESPYRVAHGDLLPITGTCPASDPPADRVLLRKAVRSGDGVREPTFEYADLDPDGTVSVDIEPPFPDNPAEHVVTMWCLAGERFVNRGVERTYRVLPTQPTSTTSSTTTTAAATSTSVVSGTATGAVPVAGSPAYTG